MKNYKDVSSLNESQIKKIKETEELLVQIFVTWTLLHDKKATEILYNDTEYHKESFTYQVLSKKLSVFDIDIKIPDYLYMIIEVCSQGNPLKSQLILWDILKHIPKLKMGHEITPDDVLLSCAEMFPITLYPEVDKEMFEAASKIKVNGGYLCDISSFWLDVFQ